MTFFREAEHSFVPQSYLHFRRFDEVYMVGGGCTDGRGFARMSDEQREQVRARGGPLFNALRYGFARFADRCAAYFGHCGDARAYEVDIAVGFEPTRHPYLLAHWLRPVEPARRDELVEKVHALGAF